MSDLNGLLIAHTDETDLSQTAQFPSIRPLVRELICALSLTACGPSQDTAPAVTPPPQPTEEECDTLYDALMEEHQAAIKKWSEEMQRANGTDEEASLFEQGQEVDRSFIPRFDGLAALGCGQAALETLDLVAHIDLADRPNSEASLKLLQSIAHNHANAWWIWNLGDNDVIGLFLDSTHKDAALPLFDSIVDQTQDVEAKRHLLLELGRELIRHSKEKPAERLPDLQRGLELLERLETEWPDSEEAEKAKVALEFEKTFAVGKVMPEISGYDVDGNKISLSDYRGKIVLLDFFGFWCGACVEALPELKQVSEEFQAQEVMILGVNGHDDRDAFLRGMDEHKITWSCIFDGEDSPLSRDLGVTSFPTLVILDPKGVIQALNPTPDALKAKIGELISER